MKRLYARLVLWLIRPALAEQRRLVERTDNTNISERIDAVLAMCASNTAMIHQELNRREAAEAAGSAGRL